MAAKKQKSAPSRRKKVSKKRGKKKREKKLSPSRRPNDLTAEAWQTGLRCQYGRDQAYVLRNLGDEPVFSEFSVTNPEQGTTHRVAIRGNRPGESFCSCPDFATNEVGTCKHIEFTLGRLERKRGGKTALQAGFAPPYSEVYLRYSSERSVHFRKGSESPPQIERSVARLFEARYDWPLPADKFGRLDNFLARARKTGHDVRCYDDALEFIARARDAEHLAWVLDDAYPEGPDSEALKNLLNTPLYPYQCEGALFAARTGRALIGDDMGLGKTIQAIAIHRNRNQSTPRLEQR